MFLYSPRNLFTAVMLAVSQRRDIRLDGRHRCRPVNWQRCLASWFISLRSTGHDGGQVASPMVASSRLIASQALPNGSNLSSASWLYAAAANMLDTRGLINVDNRCQLYMGDGRHYYDAGRMMMIAWLILISNRGGHIITLPPNDRMMVKCLSVTNFHAFSRLVFRQNHHHHYFGLMIKSNRFSALPLTAMPWWRWCPCAIDAPAMQYLLDDVGGHILAYDAIFASAVSPRRL